MSIIRLIPIFLFVLSLHLDLFAQDQQDLDLAYESYVNGENAILVKERRESFNQALEYYTSFESKWTHSSLYYNIGNSYFQLGEYPWAILYYQRALQLMPRHQNAKENLLIAQKKLDIIPESKKGFLQRILFFHDKLSIWERLQTFFVFTSLSIVLMSLYIWREWKKLRTAAGGLLIGALCLALSIAWTNYFSPLHAVVVRAAPLYRDAGKQYQQVSDFPVPSGETVEVLEVKESGGWLKIRTRAGMFGYLSHEVVRLI